MTQPYVGLQPFSAQDAAFFFGRESERHLIATNLRTSRLTVLHGPSGVGKSSVLDAGVVHDLKVAREEAGRRRPEGPRPFAAAYFRNWSDWRHRPLEGLTRAIHDTLVRDYGIELPGGPGKGFAATIAAWMEHQAGGLAIVLDQFEEYLLYEEGGDGAGTVAFELPRLVGDDSLRVNVLIGIRSDALGQLERFKGRIPHLFDNRLQLRPLSRHAGERAIRGPLEQLRRMGEGEVAIEDKLVDKVLDEVTVGRVRLAQGRQSGSFEAAPGAEEPIEAPYLQLVMERIWDAENLGSRQPIPVGTLALDTFKHLGWAKKIVQDHLDARLGQLTHEEQDSAAKLFRYLVTPSGAKIALSESDLAGIAELPQARVAAVLHRLTGGTARILRPVDAPKGHRAERAYEIFHDALAEAVLAWSTRHAEVLYARERRRKRAFRAAAVVLGVLVVGLFVLVLRDELKDDRESHARALAALATRTLPDDPDGSLLLTLQAAAQTYRPYKRLVPEVEEALHHAMTDSREEWDLPVPRQRLESVAVSPDGAVVALGGEAGDITLWDAATGRRLCQLAGHTGAIAGLDFSPDGKRLASASADSTARIWDLPCDSTAVVLRHAGAVEAVAFDPGSSAILTGSRDRTAVLWDGAGHRLRTYTGSSSPVSAVGFASLGEWVVTASWDGIARVYDRRTGVRRCAFREHASELYALAVIPGDEPHVATGGVGNRIAVWSASDCRLRYWLRGHTNSVWDLTASRHGHYLGSAGADGVAIIWNTNTGEEAFSLRGHSQTVSGIAFSPDGGQVYTSSWDSTARVWDASDVLSEVPARQARGPTVISQVAFRPGHAQLAVVDGRSIVFSDLRRPLRSTSLPLYGAASLAFSPDGRLLAVGSQGKVTVFDVDAWRQTNLLTLPRSDTTADEVTALAFAPRGDGVVIGGKNGVVDAWNLSDSTARPLGRHLDRVNSLSFSPQGDRLVSASKDGTAILWRFAQDTAAVDTLRGHSNWVTAATFSPDGKLIATAGDDRLILVFSAAPGHQLTQKLSGHTNTIWSLAFSPDGRRLASAGLDGTTRVWDLASGTQVLRLASGPGGTFGVAFSPDGGYLASTGVSGVRVWVYAPDALLARAWLHVSHTLSSEQCHRYFGHPCSETARFVLDGRAAARAGEVDTAVVRFREAYRVGDTFRGLDPDSLARELAVDAAIDEGLKRLNGQHVEEAMVQFRKVKQLVPGRERDVLRDVTGAIVDLLRGGDTTVVGPALAIYREAVAWDTAFTPSAETLNSVCWWGSLARRAAEVADVCEAAVEAGGQDPNIRDSRGVNRALRGDFAGAMEDFRAFVAESLNPEDQKARRRRWLEALAAGRNPFTDRELEELRHEGQ